MNKDKIKICAFDVFNTVVDFSSAKKEDLRSYANQIKRPIWEPLNLPDEWAYLPPFPDSIVGALTIFSRSHGA